MEKVFIERLKELRVDNKVSQRALAAAIDTSQGAIAHWEKGIRNPDITSFKKLCLYFDVSADYLLGLKDE